MIYIYDDKVTISYSKMAADSATQQRHRPGALKQQNKTHKHGKHKSKGQMDRDTKGEKT